MATTESPVQKSHLAPPSARCWCDPCDVITTSTTAQTIESRFHASLYAIALLMFALTIIGCGGSSTAVIVNPTGTPASMPTPPAPSAANTYIGTDSQSTWSLHLDDGQQSYSYSGGTGNGVQGSGSFQAENGFLALTGANGASQGYALEVQGRMALLRPGDSTATLVAAVPQTACYSIPYRLRFDYVPMEAGPGQATFTSSNYGSIVLSTDTSGANWQFEGLEGTPVSGPTSFTASCSASGSTATVSMSSPSLFNLDNNGSSLFPYVSTSTDVIDTSLTLGPSGIFVTYQTDSSFTFNRVSAGTIGIAQPTAALSSSAITAGSYLGFLTQAAQDNQGNGIYQAPGSTSPVAFGPSSTTTMIGGTFPNDDVNNAANTGISITLGSQSSVINGLYASASITMPDPNQNCVTDLVLHPTLKITPGNDAQGYPICTFPAVAVVGNPEGKFAVFLDSFNYTANSIATQIGAPMQIYLYQQ